MRNDPGQIPTIRQGRKRPAAARNLISPFPVSPSRGTPGREGSPHAGGTLRASQKLARIDAAGSPHKRMAGAAPAEV
jgi:hypothetical protein